MNTPDEHDYDIVNGVMTDETDVIVRSPVQNLWILHLALEMAMKHPSLRFMTKKAYRDINREVERVISEFNPRVLWVMNSPLKHEQHRPADRTLLENAMMSPAPLDVVLRIWQVWLAVSALQLLARHPVADSTLYDGTRRVVGEMTALLEAQHPGTAAIIAKGWDESWDQPS